MEKQEYLKAKVLKLKKIEKNESQDIDGVKEYKKFEIKILEGENKGKTVEIEIPIFVDQEYNIFIKENQNVVVSKDANLSSDGNYVIIDIDRRGSLMAILFLFVLFTVFIAKFKGAKAILSLGIVVVIIYNVFLPLIALGFSPILISTICALFSSIVTIYLTTGFSKKGTVAILGAVLGVIVAGILSMYFSYKMAMTGFISIEIINSASLLQGIKVKEIISAGVILGSMGAVMDVSMSISSALTELKNRVTISKKELFNCGMRIGSDIIGTMVNTLVLAYIGSGILPALFIYLQKDSFPLIRILNYESIAADMLRALVGSIGILVAVPITSYLSCIMFKKKSNVN